MWIKIYRIEIFTTAKNIHILRLETNRHFGFEAVRSHVVAVNLSDFPPVYRIPHAHRPRWPIWYPWKHSLAASPCQNGWFHGVKKRNSVRATSTEEGWRTR